MAERYGRWSAPEVGLSIEYRLALMAEIRAAPSGVLFGSHARASLKILKWRPIAAHDDRRDLVRQLLAAKQDPELQSLQPVGWFVSHARGDISLDLADLEIFDGYFAEPWQVTLVLSPTAEGAARAGFFVRETGGNLQSGKSYQEFLIEPPVLAKAKRLRLLWAIPTLLAMVLAGLLIRPPHAAPVNPGMFLRIQGDGPELQINWAPASVRGAKRGELEIQEGGQRWVFQLAGAQLSRGQMNWQRHTGDVQVGMTVYPASGTEVREFARFRLAAAWAPAPSAAPDTQREELKKLSEELRKERVRSEKLQNRVKILENRLEADTSRSK